MDITKSTVDEDNKIMDEVKIRRANSESPPAPGLATLPDRQAIEQLAKDDRVLYTALRVGETQKLTWEDTMMFAVKFLVERNRETQKTLTEHYEKFGNPSFFIEKSG